MTREQFIEKVYGYKGNPARCVCTCLYPHQSLFFSYPSLTNRSPAASLNIFLWSSVKYFFHSPVFPERKVGERLGLMEDSSESRINCRGACSGTRARKWSMMRVNI